MAHYIKTGFWEKAQRGALGWLDLDRLIKSISGTIINPAEPLVNAAIMDIANSAQTLTSSSATRTFTISYTGDEMTLEVILNTATATYTFPANSLCVSEGSETGNNTLTLTGVSGDHYLIGIRSINNTYYIIAKNFGQ